MAAAKFKVAICGGGVGGLTMAVALSKYPDIEVEVFEAANKFAEIGAGFGFWPRPLKVLLKFGPDFERDLLKVATDYTYTEELVPAVRYRKSDQPEGVDLFQMMTKGHPLRLHRADFHTIMLSYLSPSCKTHTSKRLVSYTQPESPDNSPITLNFTDGSSSMCDMLVGADGIKSAVRSCMMRDISRSLSGQAADFALSCADPIWSGLTIYRALVKSEDLLIRAPDHSVFKAAAMYLGKDVSFIAYPISNGKLVNFTGFHVSEELARTCYEPDTTGRKGFDGPWVHDLTKEEICKLFGGLEKEAEQIVECIEKGSLWAAHVVKCLPTQYHGRVALIGDAAHAMVPFQAAGAGQSVEDAYLLATVLGHSSTTLETIPHALAIYDKLRRPFANKVAMNSMLDGRMCAWQMGDISGPELNEEMTKNRQWAWCTDMDDELREAMELLESK